MTRLRHVLLSGLLFISLLPLHAQTTTDKFSAPVIEDEMTVDPERNKLWRTGQARYPAKPKNMWELGLHGGTAFISGDVDAVFPAGYAFGLHLRKAINYTLSFRLDGTYHVSYGYDARSFNFLEHEKTYQQNLDDSPVLVGYTDENSATDNIHRNYKAEILSFSLEGILPGGVLPAT